MIGLKSPGKELGRQKSHMIAPGQLQRFAMKVVDRCCGMAPKSQSESLILNQLQAFDGGSGVVGIHDRRRVIHD